MTGMRVWEYEFGIEAGVPRQFDALVQLGVLCDHSWHNDTCQRFCRDIGGSFVVNIWVEREAPADRECEDMPRFSVTLEDEDLRFDPFVLYSGEDMPAALAAACNVEKVNIPAGGAR